MYNKPLLDKLDIKVTPKTILTFEDSVGFSVSKEELDALKKIVSSLKVPKTQEELEIFAEKYVYLSSLFNNYWCASYMDESCGHTDKKEYKLLREQLQKIGTVSGKLIADLQADIEKFDVSNSPRFVKLLKFYSKYNAKNKHTRKFIAELQEITSKEEELYLEIENDVDYGEIRGEKATKFDKSRLLKNKDREYRTEVVRHYKNKATEIKESLYLLLASLSKKRNEIAKIKGFKDKNEAECIIQYFLDNDFPYKMYDYLKGKKDLYQRVVDLRKKILKLEKIGSEDFWMPLFDEKEISYEKTLSIIDTHLTKPTAKQWPDYEKNMKVLMSKLNIGLKNNPKRGQGAWNCEMYNDKEVVSPTFFGMHKKGIEDVRTIAHEVNHGMHNYFKSKDHAINDSGTPSWFKEAMAMSAEVRLLNNWIHSSDTTEELKRELLMQKIEDSVFAVFGQTQVHMLELGFYDGTINSYEEFQKREKEMHEDFKMPNFDYHEDIENNPILRTHHFNHTLYCINYVIAELMSAKLASMNFSEVAKLAEGLYSALGKDEVHAVFLKYNIDLSNTKWIDDAFKEYEKQLVEMEKLTS